MITFVAKSGRYCALSRERALTSALCRRPNDAGNVRFPTQRHFSSCNESLPSMKRRYCSLPYIAHVQCPRPLHCHLLIGKPTSQAFVNKLQDPQYPLHDLHRQLHLLHSQPGMTGCRKVRNRRFVDMLFACFTCQCSQIQVSKWAIEQGLIPCSNLMTRASTMLMIDMLWSAPATACRCLHIQMTLRTGLLEDSAHSCDRHTRSASPCGCCVMPSALSQVHTCSSCSHGH